MKHTNTVVKKLWYTSSIITVHDSMVCTHLLHKTILTYKLQSQRLLEIREFDKKKVIMLNKPASLKP